MKKLALALLSLPLTLVAVTVHANTYTVTFHNPAGSAVTMIPKVTPSNSATLIACSGGCTSLPPNGDVVYKISSNSSSFPWGIFTAILTYTESSNTCDSAIQGTTIGYNEVSVAGNPSSVSFLVSVGEQLPQGLYGNISIVSKCSTYK
jgi:hypothetical protein